MRRLLDYLENAASVHFYVGEFVWPTLEQVDAAVAELSAQPRASSLVLRLVQQLEKGENSSFDFTQFDSVLQRLCDRLRESAPHVSSISLELLVAGTATAPSPAAQLAAVAGLTSMKQLALRSEQLQPGHFSAMSTLTQLTSVDLTLRGRLQVATDSQAALQQLQPLSNLQRLKLAARYYSGGYSSLQPVQLQLPAAFQTEACAPQPVPLPPPHPAADSRAVRAPGVAQSGAHPAARRRDSS
jgi:hypothetical protein